MPTGGCHYRVANPMSWVEIGVLQPGKKGLLRHGPHLTGTDSGSAQEMDRRVPPDLPLKIQPLSIGSQEDQAGPSNGLLCLWVLGSEQLPHLILRHHPFTLLPQWHLPFP